jgi:hypothetical protein
MKTIILSTLVFIASFAIAQDFCVTDNFKKFRQETKLECKNLVLANLTFMDNGKTAYPIGQTAMLDSLAQYFAQKQYIFEIDYETKDKKISSEEVRRLEEGLRDYLISKNSVNQVKAFPEAHDKIDHSAYIPQNMNAAFFFIVIYTGTE